MNLQPLKTLIALVGGVAFLAGGLTVAWHARHYQVAGQPMPNGKGGFMSFRDGYYIALAMSLIALAWFMAARRFASVSLPPSTDANKEN